MIITAKNAKALKTKKKKKITDPDQQRKAMVIDEVRIMGSQVIESHDGVKAKKAGSLICFYFPHQIIIKLTVKHLFDCELVKDTKK